MSSCLGGGFFVTPSDAQRLARDGLFVVGRDTEEVEAAIGALLSVGGSNPWWSLAIFALCVFIVHGVVVYGEDEAAARR